MTAPEDTDLSRIPWGPYAGQPWSKVDTGPGWWPIIAELTDQLTEALGETEWYASQIKEKFGGLRYYVTYPNGDYLTSGAAEIERGLIRAAEERCAVTCEACGRSGELRSPRGWYVTLCDEDFAAREATRAAWQKELNGE